MADVIAFPPTATGSAKVRRAAIKRAGRDLAQWAVAESQGDYATARETLQAALSRIDHLSLEAMCDRLLGPRPEGGPAAA